MKRREKQRKTELTNNKMFPQNRYKLDWIESTPQILAISANIDGLCNFLGNIFMETILVLFCHIQIGSFSHAMIKYKVMLFRGKRATRLYVTKQNSYILQTLVPGIID